MVLVALNTSTNDITHKMMNTDQITLSPFNILEKKLEESGVGYEV